MIEREEVEAEGKLREEREERGGVEEVEEDGSGSKLTRSSAAHLAAEWRQRSPSWRAADRSSVRTVSFEAIFVSA